MVIAADQRRVLRTGVEEAGDAGVPAIESADVGFQGGLQTPRTAPRRGPERRADPHLDVADFLELGVSCHDVLLQDRSFGR
jgi:hypothetical protein